MRTISVQCPGCPTTLTIQAADQIGGKLSFAAGAALLGSQAMKNPVAIVACALIGLAIGHLIDTEIVTKCPECGQVIRIAGTLLEYS